MESSEKNVATVFKALGDENRIRILKLLRSGEKCACQLMGSLDISQPTLSHHMKILCDAGIVKGRKDGKWIHYSINCQGACHVRDMLYATLAPENQPEGCTCEH